MKTALASAALLLASLTPAVPRAAPAVEWHHRVQADTASGAPPLALTLDACSGAYDAELIALLVRLHVLDQVRVEAVDRQG